MPAFNFKTHASPKLGQGRPEKFQLSPQASRALLGSPESSPSLSRFFARRSPTLPEAGTLGPLRVPLMPETEVLEHLRLEHLRLEPPPCCARRWP